LLDLLPHDFIYLVTCRLISLIDDWQVNVLLAVSHHFGFGLLDVAAMVDLARNWTTVPEQHCCDIASRHAAR